MTNCTETVKELVEKGEVDLANAWLIGWATGIVREAARNGDVTAQDWLEAVDLTAINLTR